MSHQTQSISLLEETDKQIKERVCAEKLRRLKEARNEYREEVIDCVRHCAWYDVYELCLSCFFPFLFFPLNSIYLDLNPR